MVCLPFPNGWFFRFNHIIKKHIHNPNDFEAAHVKYCNCSSSCPCRASPWWNSRFILYVYIIIYIYIYYIIPLGYSCIKSGGLCSKNSSILYRGIPLWLGSTGEGCDSIQVSGCQTRAWRSTFCTRASLVHMVLRVLILYWCPFYARLEAGLGVPFLYYAKMQPKIKPLFLFFHCEAWESWFYTDAYIYSII